MQNKYRNLLSNTLLFTIGSFGSKFILFFLVPLYTNCLTTEEYGVADLINTSVNLIIPFITLSVNDAILRFTLSKQIKPENVIKNSILVLCSAILLICAMYPIIDYIKPFGDWTYIFIILTSLSLVRGAFSIYLKAIDRIKIFTIDSIIYTFSLAILNILLLVIFKWEIKGYFYAQIISMIFSIIYQSISGLILSDIRKGKVDRVLLKQMLKYSTPLIVNAISWWIINSIDRYMINFYMTSSDVGIYAVASKMPALLTTITSIFSSAWVISSIVEYEESKDEEFYSNVFSYYMCFLTLFCSLVLIIIKPFMSIYVGNNFNDSWKYVPFLLVGSIYYTFSNFFMTLYKSEKKNLREISATTIGAIFNIVINLLLIPKIGIIGACIATYFSQLLLIIYCIHDTRKFFKFRIDFKLLILNSFILLIQCINLWLYTKITLIISIICLIILTYINRNNMKTIIRALLDLIKRKGVSNNEGKKS